MYPFAINRVAEFLTFQEQICLASTSRASFRQIHRYQQTAKTFCCLYTGDARCNNMQFPHAVNFIISEVFLSGVVSSYADQIEYLALHTVQPLPKVTLPRLKKFSLWCDRECTGLSHFRCPVLEDFFIPDVDNPELPAFLTEHPIKLLQLYQLHHEFLQTLGWARELRSFILESRELWEDELILICTGMPKLEHLEANYQYEDGSCLPYLGRIKTCKLDVIIDQALGTPSSRDFHQLMSFPGGYGLSGNLEHMWLDDTVRASSLEELDTFSISADLLAKFVEDASLIRLKLTNFFHSRKGLFSKGRFDQLQEMTFDNANISDKDIAQIIRHAPNLHIIQFNNTPIGMKTCRALAERNRTKVLVIRKCPYIREIHLHHLLRCTRLRDLRLGVSISDTFLKKLSQLPLAQLTLLTCTTTGLCVLVRSKIKSLHVCEDIVLNGSPLPGSYPNRRLRLYVQSGVVSAKMTHFMDRYVRTLDSWGRLMCIETGNWHMFQTETGVREQMQFPRLVTAMNWSNM